MIETPRFEGREGGVFGTEETGPCRARSFAPARVAAAGVVRTLDSQSPFWQRPGMETTASSLKLRADVLEG